ncbi:MAG: hypothetical protein RSD63_09450 [Eubacterium sp.]
MRDIWMEQIADVKYGSYGDYFDCRPEDEREFVNKTLEKNKDKHFLAECDPE